MSEASKSQSFLFLSFLWEYLRASAFELWDTSRGTILEVDTILPNVDKSANNRRTHCPRNVALFAGCPARPVPYARSWDLCGCDVLTGGRALPKLLDAVARLVCHFGSHLEASTCMNP